MQVQRADKAAQAGPRPAREQLCPGSRVLNMEPLAPGGYATGDATSNLGANDLPGQDPVMEPGRTDVI